MNFINLSYVTRSSIYVNLAHRIGVQCQQHTFVQSLYGMELATMRKTGSPVDNQKMLLHLLFKFQTVQIPSGFKADADTNITDGEHHL